MLLSAQTTRYAHRLLASRANAEQIAPLSAAEKISLTDAYIIAKSICDIRIAQGELVVGHKIGFAHHNLWPTEVDTLPIEHLIFATIFDTTLRFAKDNYGIQSLRGALQPRIEPKIVFGLARAPDANATVSTISECIEWMAHGLEVVTCPYPGWKFDTVDAIAGFGLHGTLIVGERTVLSHALRRNLVTALELAGVSLSCERSGNFSLRGAGFGSSEFGSPVHALWYLHRLLKKQPRYSTLKAGEIIATGAWTDAYPIEAGQTWATAFSGISLPGLTVSFV